MCPPNVLHGTYNGGTLGVTGAVSVSSNTAYRVDGSAGQYADRSDNSALKPTTGLTLIAWAKWTSTTGARTIVRKGNGAKNWALSSPSSSDGVRFNVWTTSGSVSLDKFTINDDAWHQIVGTWDGTNARLYVDGVLVTGPTALGGTIDTDTSTVAIGAATGGSNRWIGDIDEVALAGAAMSAADIATLYGHAIGVSSRTITHNIGKSTHILQVTPTAPTLGTIYVSKAADSDVVHSTNIADAGAFDWAVIEDVI